MYSESPNDVFFQQGAQAIGILAGTSLSNSNKYLDLYGTIVNSITSILLAYMYTYADQIVHSRPSAMIKCSDVYLCAGAIPALTVSL